MEKSFLNYLDNYEVGIALNTLEKFFWDFCDNYVEIVKHRLYRPEEFGEIPRYSGQKTIYIILYKLLQFFSIFFPFITEEIFQDIYHNNISIHTTDIKPFDFKFEDEVLQGNKIVEIISFARGQKAINNVSLKNKIKILSLAVDNKLEFAIRKSEKDFKATLFIENLEIGSKQEDGYNVDKIELNLEEKQD